MAENKRKFVIGQFLLWTIGAVLISVLFFVLAVDKKKSGGFCCNMLLHGSGGNGALFYFSEREKL